MKHFMIARLRPLEDQRFVGLPIAGEPMVELPKGVVK